MFVPGRDLTFLFELLLSHGERAMLKSLHADPTDKDLRGVYADYLEEAGRIESAGLVRGSYTPGVGTSSAQAGDPYSCLVSEAIPSALVREDHIASGGVEALLAWRSGLGE